MASFCYLKHKLKTLKFAQQHLKTQSSFWVKIHFDPMIRWGGLDKINVHKVYDL
jgi:SOS-response transcriptional repressor LexA